MGWANCGTDSKGRPIGYAHDATCDHPGCDAKIDRGLSYACGGMHGTRDRHDVVDVCEGYFCGEHKRCVMIEGYLIWVCFACYENLKDLDEEPEEEESRA